MIRSIHIWLAENTDYVQFPPERLEPTKPAGTPWYWRMLLGFLGLLGLMFCCVAVVVLGASFAAVFF